MCDNTTVQPLFFRAQFSFSSFFSACLLFDRSFVYSFALTYSSSLFFWLHLHLTFNRFLICTHRRMQIYTQIYLHRIILQQFCKFIQITNCVASKMTVCDFGRWIKMQTKFNVKSSLHWELSLGLLLVSLSK